MDTVFIFRSIDDEGELKPCLAVCEDISYRYMVTQTSFPNRRTFGQGDNFCNVLMKVDRACSGKQR